MKLPIKHRSVSTWVVVPSAIVVCALGVLQYRWSTGVSEATAVRLADSLQMSLVNWQIDFFRYFAEIGLAMGVDPLENRSESLDEYGHRLEEWKRIARYPKLVSNVYLLKPGENAKGQSLQLDQSSYKFEERPWPDAFRTLQPDLQDAAVRIRQEKEPATRHGLSPGWKFEPSIPALLHPLQGEQGWVAIELNRDEIKSRVFSDLSQTYFQGTNGLDFLIAVVSRNEPEHILYSSDPGFGYPEPADADGTIDVFGRPHSDEILSPVRVFHAPAEDKGPSPSMRIAWFPLLRESAPNLDWRLVVRHRRGGALGAFVAEIRRRDLAIGFGMLLVVVINMAMLVVTSHRAQRLAQLQMDFVTAVSHELRTPLTVIISGADNIRNGVVENTQQMMQYGSLIGKQARNLFGLVERILLFSATRQGDQRYNLQSLQVGDVIATALASSEELIAAAEFTIERDIEAGLPPVLADPAVLAQCFQNLITNALKYGKSQRWIGIRACALDKEIQVSISDRGMGISPEDLRHIFEPFYRSPAVRDAQIPGTGLGLPLSKSIAEAMQGSLTATSSVGQGSTFTVHLPALPEGA